MVFTGIFLFFGTVIVIVTGILLLHRSRLQQVFLVKARGKHDDDAYLWLRPMELTRIPNVEMGVLMRYAQALSSRLLDLGVHLQVFGGLAVAYYTQKTRDMPASGRNTEDVDMLAPHDTFHVVVEWVHRRVAIELKELQIIDERPAFLAFTINGIEFNIMRGGSGNTEGLPLPEGICMPEPDDVDGGLIVSIPILVSAKLIATMSESRRQGHRFLTDVNDLCLLIEYHHLGGEYKAHLPVVLRRRWENIFDECHRRSNPKWYLE